DLATLDVDADDVVTLLREARGDDRANVSESDDGDPHDQRSPTPLRVRAAPGARLLTRRLPSVVVCDCAAGAVSDQSVGISARFGLTSPIGPTRDLGRLVRSDQHAISVVSRVPPRMRARQTIVGDGCLQSNALDIQPEIGATLPFLTATSAPGSVGSSS